VVGNLHLLEDSSAIVRHGDISVGGNENLVESARAKRRLDNICDGTGGENMRFDGFVAKLALLLALTKKRMLGELKSTVKSVIVINVLSDDNEGASLLILHNSRCYS
jgi:hypothetical protein